MDIANSSEEDETPSKKPRLEIAAPKDEEKVDIQVQSYSKFVIFFT